MLAQEEVHPNDLPALLGQIEDVNRDCFRIQTAAGIRLQRTLAELQAVRTERRTMDEARTQLQRSLDNTRHDILVALLSTRTRAAANSLRSSLPGSRTLVELRAGELKEELRIVGQTCEAVIAALQEPRTAESFNHIFNKAGKQMQYQNFVANLLPVIDTECQGLLSAAEEQVTAFQATITSVAKLQEQPMTVELSYAEVSVQVSYVE